MQTTATPVGVKDTKEAMIGINELSLTLAKTFADGIQFTDVMDLWKKLSEDTAFKDQLLAAYEGWSNISAEVADIDATEALELVGIQMSYVPRYLEVLGKSSSLASAKTAPAKK